MPTENFFNIIAATANARRDKVAFRQPGGEDVAYGSFLDRALQYAGVFADLGFQPGDRLLVQTEKSIENVALYFGALAAGMIYVPLNTAYTDLELKYFIDDAEPACVICTPERLDAVSNIAGTAGARLFTLDENGEGEVAALADAAAPGAIVSRAPEDIAVILYTSGTTGRSKGAMLSHRALASNARALIDCWRISENDTLLHALPIFHIHGLFVALHTILIAGGDAIFLSQFSTEEVSAHLPDATIFMGVPTFYSRLIETGGIAAETTRNTRLFISGSAPLTPQTHEAFAERTGRQILERYGMSEAGIITSNPLDGDRIPGTVGYPLDGVEVRIAGGGSSGEIEVKGDSLFSGYWRNEEKTNEAITPDGWFKTGDIGSIDQSGRLAIVGREKDLIIVGGYNVYPKEIEAILDNIDGVAESAVIGAPHPDMGEGVIGVLVGDSAVATPAVLQSAIDGLAKFKRPRKFFWLDALPRNAMGKVQKAELRRRYKDAFTA